MFYELFREILSSVRRNKLRTALTGFSVAWGIFMLIFLLGAGNGLINAQVQATDRYLANSMVASGGRTSKAYDGLGAGRGISLRRQDMATTDSVFAGVVRRVAAVYDKGGVTIASADNYMTGQTLSGVYPADREINKRQVVQGRFINDIDMKERRKVAVVSEDQARELWPQGGSPVGKAVRADGLVWRVVGVYRGDGMVQATDVFCPHTTVCAIYGAGDRVGNIEFTFGGLETEAQNDAFEADYTAKLNLNHRAAPDDASAVWLWNRFMGNIQMAKGIAMLRTALWVVGLLTLLSGIVGVSNIMLIAVRERTREFGIRKAIGAGPWAILRLVVAESVAITAVFGYIGMLCGIAANEYMAAAIGRTQVDTGLFKATMFADPTVGIGVCLQATLVIIAAGTLAGLAPARRAARVRPIEAMKEH